MGRLIDGDELLIHKTWINGPSGDSIYDVVFCDEIEKAPIVEAIIRSDYETRLKTDMVDMLEDLRQDLIAESYGIAMDCTDYVVNVADIDKVIQQKINKLKEYKDA